MRRRLAGLTFGLLVAMLTIMLAETIGNQFFSTGLPADPSATLPAERQSTELLAANVVGWGIAAFLGSATAIFLSGRQAMAWFVAAAILVGLAARMLVEVQPLWVYFVAPWAPLAGALLARLVTPHRTLSHRTTNE